MNEQPMGRTSKVAAVTLAFWVIKILATTLGETGGDAVSMSWLGKTTPSAGSAGLNGYLVGYSGAALLFGAALVALSVLCFTTSVSRVALFWAAFVLTRPLGATVGDFLDKPVAKGGLEFTARSPPRVWRGRLSCLSC